MPRENTENAPRGTWNDDKASSREPESRRSVSGPYRDATETLRARRAALQREIEDLDQWINRRVQAGRELVAIERQIHAAARPATVALRSVVRGVLSLAPGFLLGALVFWPVTWAERPVSVIAHDSPAVVRLGGQRFVVARAAIDRLLSTSGAGAQIEPYLEKGTIVGLRLDRLPPASELRDLGLFEGDVILAVDGNDIARPNGARDAYARLRSAWQFELVLMRGGVLRRLVYEVVG